MLKAIDSYLTAHPHTANQTFHNLVAHINLHSPNFSQSAGDVGCTASVQSSNISSTVATLLDSPTFITALATAAAVPPLPRSPRLSWTGRGGQRGQQKKTTHLLRIHHVPTVTLMDTMFTPALTATKCDGALSPKTTLTIRVYRHTVRYQGLRSDVPENTVTNAVGYKPPHLSFTTASKLASVRRIRKTSSKTIRCLGCHYWSPS